MPASTRLKSGRWRVQVRRKRYYTAYIFIRRRDAAWHSSGGGSGLTQRQKQVISIERDLSNRDEGIEKAAGISHVMRRGVDEFLTLLLGQDPSELGWSASPELA